MTQENVELVRRAFSSVNRGDVRSALEAAADDFEMDWSNSIGPVNGVYRGRGQVTEAWESFLEAWDALRWDMQEVVDLDDADQVLVVNRVRMRGRTSHADVEATGAQLWTIHKGKLRSLKLYQSKADALEAVGLSEQDAHADS
jgi:ketosteroid isomerase-like protein